MRLSASFARNFRADNKPQLEDGQDQLTGGIGYALKRYPYMCGAFKIDPGALANMKLRVSFLDGGETREHTVNVLLNAPTTRGHMVGAIWPDIVDDGEWH